MPKDGENISDEAVKKATGRDWAAWLKVLDSAGAKTMNHKKIVAAVKKHWLAGHSSKSEGWYAQMVTVEYERRRGKRKLGQTADAGYQIGVTKTLPISKKQAWDLLMSPAGKKLWAGRGVKTEKRTGRDGEFMRMTWESSQLKEPSVLQLRVGDRETSKGTCISFHQEKLSSGAEREKMKQHWKNALATLAELT